MTRYNALLILLVYILGLQLIVAVKECGIDEMQYGLVGKKRPLKILVSSDKDYLPVYLNWLSFYRKLCSNDDLLYFICLDAETDAAIQQYNLTCSQKLERRDNNQQLWLFRTKLLSELLHSGYDVLMSDADALWLKDPFFDLQKYSAFDIVSSRGSHPIDVTKKLGASLCMGFIFVHSTAATVVFFQDLYVYMLKLKSGHDDQRDLNRQLYKQGLYYSTKVSLKSSSPNAGKFVYRGNSMNVLLLPQNSYRRLCKNVTKAVALESSVLHCYLDKNWAIKKEGARIYGLWVV